MREIGAMGAIWDKTWEQTKVWAKMHQDQMAKQPKYNFNVGSQVQSMAFVIDRLH